MSLVKKRRFKGILNRPIRGVPLPPVSMPRLAGSLASLDRLGDRRRTALDEQRDERLRALHEHYGVDQAQPAERALRELVIRMAEDFVPGFRVVPAEHRIGAPKTRTLAADVELLEAVATRMNRNKRLSPKGACMQLAGPGKKYDKRSSGESLYTTYLAAKKRIPNHLLLKAVLAHPRGRVLSSQNEDEILDAVFGHRE